MSKQRIINACRSCAKRGRVLGEHLIDRVLRVRTEPESVLGGGVGRHGDGTAYEPVSWFHLWALRRELVGVDSSRVVVADLGCGAGRVLLAAAALGVDRAIGIEVDDELVSVAASNARSTRFLRACEGIEVLAIDACEWVPTELDVVFMFNPFGEKTLARVLDNLCAIPFSGQRPVRILYHNPVHRRVLDEHQQVTFLRTRRVRGFLHPTLIYEIGRPS